MKYPERILIVLNQDGTFKAGQMEQLELNADGVPVKQHFAEAITEEAARVILPDSAMLIAQVAELQSQLAASAENVRAALAREDDARQVIANLDAANRTLTSHIAELSAELARVTGA